MNWNSAHIRFIKIGAVLCLFSSLSFLQLQSQPISGCYTGAYLGCGPVDSSCISPTAFNALCGKNHYCFSRYVDAGNDNDLLNPSHWDWADTLASLGAKPVFFLMPLDGLVNYSNGSRDAALTLFAGSCAAFSDTVYIVFGHEMNGTWYPYAGTPQEYVDAFRHVSTVLRSVDPKIRMCWVLIQAWGQNPYLPYYPGDDYTDWVGLNLYDRDYDENNHFYESQLDSAISYLNFYRDFSALKNKPMMVGESSLFDPNFDPTAAGVRVPLTQEQQWNEQNEWITALYNKDSLQSRYPNLNMIIFFHVKKLEYDFGSQNHSFGNLTADWRIPLDGSFNMYSGLIADPYFIGPLPTGIHDAKEKGSGIRLKVFPNPTLNSVEIEYYLPVQDSFQISLLGSKGEKIASVREGSFQGMESLSFSVKDLEQGVYYVVIETKKKEKLVRKVIIED